MDYTTNYNLNLPSGDDSADVEKLNENAEIIDRELFKKVDGEEGKGLSTNDYTTAEKDKLAGIEAGAEVNKPVDQNYMPASENAQSGTAVAEAVADFITNTVNNLTNYYLKSETYDRTEVNNLIGAIQTAHFEIVNVLPPIGENNVIYLILRSDPETSNIYDEYIYIDNAYEKIGSTDVDLTGYATENWVNQQIANFLTQTQIQSLINTALTNYYTKIETTALLNTKADKYNPMDYIPYIKENNDTTITITVTTETGRRNLVGEIIIPAFIEGLPVKKLDSSAFAYCTHITRMYLPDTLTTINDRAFQGCSALEYINIPDSVTWLGIRAFQACPLVDITLPLNMRFEGQAVFIATATQAHLERVVIKSAVTSLPSELFSGQLKLESVYIPETVTSIGASAFSNCNALSDVYFGGTQAQWNAITVGSANTALATATIHYNQRPAIMQDVLDNSSPIKSISQNGTPITPDSSGNVNITGGGGGTVDQTYDPTSTNAQSGTAVAEAVENKLTEPSSGLAVGKYFRVASIDNDGHAVLECVDAPIFSPSIKEGTALPSGSLVADFIGQLYHCTQYNVWSICTEINNGAYTWKRIFLENAVTGVVIGNNCHEGNSIVAIGYGINSSVGVYSTMIGTYSKCSSNYSIAIGAYACVEAGGNQRIQIGAGTNTADETLQVFNYRLLKADGTIPPERITSAAWTDTQRLAVLLSLGCTVDENGYVKWTAQS